MKTNSPDLTAPDMWRSGRLMRSLLDKLRATATRPWKIMEVCGGQTFTLSRYRLEEMLPAGIRMIHGPGCPVCVTPADTIDCAIELAMRPEVIMCSFGDMLRVPGSSGSLLRAKARGADVRILYSPLDALDIARSNPSRQVIFFAIGFETTTPLYAMLVKKAGEAGIHNFSLLTSLFTVPAAVRAIRSDPECQVDALLAAGHVCAVTGTAPYTALAAELCMPVVVTGFEPVDMLLGINQAVEMLEEGTAGMSNAYTRVVAPQGNPAALAVVDEIFEQTDAGWRGIGTLPASGMKLRKDYEHFDARVRFNYQATPSSPCLAHEGCIAGKIMRGLAKPTQCPHFATKCCPSAPIGAPMVSEEGACAAYYRYRQ